MSDGNATSPSAKANYAEVLLAFNCAMVLVLVLVAINLCVLPLIKNMSGTRVIVVYWATGQQLVHHGNPYDPLALGQLEHAAGFTGTSTYYMRNPPWSLPLVLPLGLISARIAALPWLLLLLGIQFLSVRLLWKMLGRPAHRLHWLGYSFTPAVLCVLMGQTSLFLLLGMVLFLSLHRTNPFWAGAALWFCSLKPHVLLPFAVALLLWIVTERAWKVLAGALAAMAASCALTEWIDPSAWSQYAQWAHNSGISREFIPCLAVVLRNSIHPAWSGLVFLPAVLGCAWAAVYFWRKRAHWDWIADGGLLTLVSLVVAPYCWIYDQSLALPALLFAAFHTRSRPLLATVVVACIAINLQTYCGLPLCSAAYLWSAPVWLAWYLLARRTAHTDQAGFIPLSLPPA